MGVVMTVVNGVAFMHNNSSEIVSDVAVREFQNSVKMYWRHNFFSCSCNGV